MKTLILFAVTSACLMGCSPPLSEAEISSFNSTKIRLTRLVGLIEQELIIQANSNQLPDIQKTLINIAKSDPDVVRSEEDRSNYFLVNPDLKLWLKGGSNEIAAYSNRVFMRKGRTNYVAVLFNGDPIATNVQPAWHPLSVRPNGKP
jgi:hypothetical protein